MIEAEGLTKRYGETQALAGVDFAVPAGLHPGRARAQRGGQDDRGPDPHHAWPSPTAAGPRWPATTWSTEAAEVRRHIGVAAQDATLDELLTGPPEPGADRRAQPDGPHRRQGPGRPSCSTGSS